MSKYSVKVGKYGIVLSPSFLRQNNAEDNLKLIKRLMKTKFKLYQQMDLQDTQYALRELSKGVKENEFKIMEAYNFEPDANKFRFWEMPKCSCPTMDNQERWGQGVGFYVSSSCLIHGDDRAE